MAWIVFKADKKVYMLPTTQVTITAYPSRDKESSYTIHYDNITASLPKPPPSFEDYNDAVAEMKKLEAE